jgi:hypothetical protein
VSSASPKNGDKLNNEYFETWQGLKKGDVLSTLIFNVVLESIVRQILGYADDFDVIGRRQGTAREAFLALELEKRKKKDWRSTKVKQIIWLRRFTTLGRAWLLATKLLKSSKNLRIWDPWWHRTTTWVWRYRGESRLPIDAFADCSNNCSWVTLRSNKIHHLQDLDPPSPAIWQWDMGVDQKRGGPTSRLW